MIVAFRSAKAAVAERKAQERYFRGAKGDTRFRANPKGVKVWFFQ
jgi:hypothetical protein